MASTFFYVVAAITLASSCTADLTNVCSGRPHNTLVRNTDDCSSYYHCFNGNPILSSCQHGELFDHLTRQCELASRVDCFQCPTDVAFVDLHVSNECNQFIRCFNNASQQLTCAEGLYFDRELQMCNLKKHVSCPFEVFCPREQFNLIFTRDSEDCNRFFVCMNGVAEPRNCPSSLYFNPVTNMCDLPQHSSCPHYSPGDDDDDEPIPESFRCPTVGGPLHPSHTDCQVFYTCSPDGMALRNRCRPDRYFNYQYMFCGKKQDVTCYSGPSVFEPTPTDDTEDIEGTGAESPNLTEDTEDIEGTGAESPNLTDDTEDIEGTGAE